MAFDGKLGCGYTKVYQANSVKPGTIFIVVLIETLYDYDTLSSISKSDFVHFSSVLRKIKLLIESSGFVL